MLGNANLQCSLPLFRWENFGPTSLNDHLLLFIVGSRTQIKNSGCLIPIQEFIITIYVFEKLFLEVKTIHKHLILIFKKYFIYLFLERGREKKRERTINVWLPPACPLLGDLTQNPVMCGGALPPSPRLPWMRISLPRHDLLGEERGQSLKEEGPRAFSSMGFYWVQFAQEYR